jgi:AcrR family transcriptional regulator
VPKIVTEEERATTRRRIIQAAAEEFALVGFEQAKMETISERAAIGKGTIYLYFESKQGLFSAVLAEISTEQLAELRQELATLQTPDLQAVLTALLGTFNRLALEQPDGFRIFISSLFGVNRKFKEEAANLRRTFLELIKTELQNFKNSGEIKLPEIEPAALLILNICELWALQSQSLGFGKEYALDHQPQIVNILLAGLLNNQAD